MPLTRREFFTRATTLVVAVAAGLPVPAETHGTVEAQESAENFNPFADFNLVWDTLGEEGRRFTSEDLEAQLSKICIEKYFIRGSDGLENHDETTTRSFPLNQDDLVDRIFYGSVGVDQAVIFQRNLGYGDEVGQGKVTTFKAGYRVPAEQNVELKRSEIVFFERDNLPVLDLAALNLDDYHSDGRLGYIIFDEHAEVVKGTGNEWVSQGKSVERIRIAYAQFGEIMVELNQDTKRNTIYWNSHLKQSKLVELITDPQATLNDEQRYLPPVDYDQIMAVIDQGLALRAARASA